MNKERKSLKKKIEYALACITSLKLLNEERYESIEIKTFLKEFKEEVCLWHFVTSDENKKLAPRSKDKTYNVKIVKINDDERKLIFTRSTKAVKINNKKDLIDRILGNLKKREIKTLSNNR
ncbi:hypothetical protein LCGC14_1039100 [marine sediment metagenome]|uniref:Uncharacterized protein n=1 Tax=marine sediment metagenome TaxID=412755 RepID=A0A0F9MWS7_9ZZZZ